MANDLLLRPPPPLLDDACALFLDVDGTLIEFADRPDAVTLLPEVREAIGRISDRLEGAVALVSGRPLEQLDATVTELAGQIARFSPQIVALGKQAFYRQQSLDEATAYDEAVEIITANAVQPEAQEGIAAFLEKRSPRWSTP